MKRQVIALFVLAAVAVAALASLSNAVSGGGPNLCPDIYAPVICDGGKIYPNLCVANNHHAKNCRPYGDI